MTERELQSITEGTTSLLIYPHHDRQRGPAKKEQVPFYNPAMELNRDLSIVLIQWLVRNHPKQFQVLDGLAASGIRGFRIAHQVKGNVVVSINDWSTIAYDLMLQNLAKTNLSNVSILHEDVHVLLSKHRYDYVDIDPFGTPAIYIDSAIRGLRHHGILAVTATDTATLCGVYPVVCRRRYGSNPHHSQMMHEIGLRILIGFIARTAATHDIGITPLLSYTTDHYMRVYIRLNRKITDANKSMNNVQTISSSQLAFQKDSTKKKIGPLWMGTIQDQTTLHGLYETLPYIPCGSEKHMITLLELLTDEAEAPPFFYTVNSIASYLNISPPSRKTLFTVFEDHDHGIWRTHIDPTGFKTDANEKEIIEIFLQAKNIDEHK